MPEVKKRIQGICRSDHPKITEVAKCAPMRRIEDEEEDTLLLDFSLEKKSLPYWTVYSGWPLPHHFFRALKTCFFLINLENLYCIGTLTKTTFLGGLQQFSLGQWVKSLGKLNLGRIIYVDT